VLRLVSMLATTTPPTVTVATTPASLTRALDAFVGSFLELVIHSVEELRERVTRGPAR
jgi:hypothetical protein